MFAKFKLPALFLRKHLLLFSPGHKESPSDSRFSVLYLSTKASQSLSVTLRRSPHTTVFYQQTLILVFCLVILIQVILTSQLCFWSTVIFILRTTYGMILRGSPSHLSHSVADGLLLPNSSTSASAAERTPSAVPAHSSALPALLGGYAAGALLTQLVYAHSHRLPTWNSYLTQPSPCRTTVCITGQNLKYYRQWKHHITWGGCSLRAVTLPGAQRPERLKPTRESRRALENVIFKKRWNDLESVQSTEETSEAQWSSDGYKAIAKPKDAVCSPHLWWKPEAKGSNWRTQDSNLGTKKTCWE